MELSAQELRIGNIVRWKYGEDEYNTVHSIDPEQIDLQIITPFGVRPEDIEGVPLTEEWLLKLGFEYHPSKHENRAFRKGKLEIVLSGNYIYTNGRTYYNSWCIIESQPNTVHQLQNLYFALTEEELTLKQTESI